MIHETLEEHLSSTCPSCGKEHNAKFFSLFVGERHYIIGDCTHCGYHIEFEESELGMGLFLPDGSPVNEQFKKNLTHMQDRGDAPVEKRFSSMKLRFADE